MEHFDRRPKRTPDARPDGRPDRRLLLAAGSLVLLGALTLWTLGGGTEPRLPAATPAGAAAATGDAADTATGELDGTVTPERPRAEPDELARSVVAPPEPGKTPGIDDHPFAFRIDVEVLDGNGLPAAGHTVLAAPIGLDLHRCEHQTDHAGRLSLQFRGRQPGMRVAVALDDGRGLDVLDLTHGRPRRVVLGTPTTGDFRFLLQPTGGPIRNDQLAQFAQLQAARVNRVVESRTLVATNWAFDLGAGQVATTPAPSVVRLPRRARAIRADALHPFARFADATQLRRQEPTASPFAPKQVAQLMEAMRAAQLNFQVQSRQNLFVTSELVAGVAGRGFGVPAWDVGQAELLIQLANGGEQGTPWWQSTAALPQKCIVEGTVFAESGAPAADQLVAWRLADDQPWQHSATDADGRYELPIYGEGTVEVRAGGGRLGLASGECQLVPGTATLDLRLWRGRTVQGRAEDADGDPLASHMVEWRSVDLHEHDSCTTADDGSFALPNRSGAPGRLWLWQGSSLVAVSPVVHPDGGDVVLRPQPREGSLSLTVALPAGCEHFPARALVWDTATGRGFRVETGDGGHLQLQELAAGNYHVVVQTDALGSVDLGVRWVDGKACTDLGTVSLPAPGDVTFERPGESDGGSDRKRTELLHRTGPPCDVRMDGFLPTTRTLTLAPGTYLWSWCEPGGEPASREFTVAPCAALTVER